jgi:hypothetical protein
MSALKSKFNLSSLPKNEVFVGSVTTKENGLAIQLFSTFDKPYESSGEKSRFGSNSLIGVLASSEPIVNLKTAWIHPKGEVAEAFASLKEGDNFNDFCIAQGIATQAITVWEVTESEYATLSEKDQARFGRTKEGELSAKVNPSTGATLLAKGEKIYTASVLTELELCIEDVFVAHDKSDAVVSAPVVSRLATRA